MKSRVIYIDHINIDVDIVKKENQFYVLIPFK